MRVTGGGSDLARLKMLQNQALATRDKLDTAGQELTTNLKANRFEATGGNLTRLFALERSLDRNAVFTQTISLTELRLEVMQESLGRILTPVENLSLDLVQTVGQGDHSSAMLHASTARQAFRSTVGILNTQVAGQSIFAGTATDSAAIAPADAILADLDAMAAGAATPSEAIAAIDAYFSKSPPGDFYTTGYLGAGEDLTAVEIGEEQRLDYGVRAEENEIVAVLRSQALAAVVAGGAFAGDRDAQLAMLGEAGDRMLSAKEGLMDLRSTVGVRQEAVERAKAERVSERDTLDLARAKLISTDPLETAATFQQLEVQLESIYTVTARLANLRFLNFMR